MGHMGCSLKQWVYFVQSCSGGPVKIGTATNPQKRLRQLQTANPDELYLRLAVPGGGAVEASLHEHFSEYRVRGEWYEPEGTLLDLLIRCDIDAGMYPLEFTL
jgi:hypothetical protein